MDRVTLDRLDSDGLVPKMTRIREDPNGGGSGQETAPIFWLRPNSI
jgi:hypothetical protein